MSQEKNFYIDPSGVVHYYPDLDQLEKGVSEMPESENKYRCEAELRLLKRLLKRLDNVE